MWTGAEGSKVKGHSQINAQRYWDPYIHTKEGSKAQKMRLYNTVKDPEEMKDLVEDPKFNAVLTGLKADFIELQKDMADNLNVDAIPTKKKRK